MVLGFTLLFVNVIEGLFLVVIAGAMLGYVG
jgi:hypothetical protein